MKQFKVGDWVYDRLEESYTKQEKLFRVTDLFYKKHSMECRIDRFQLWQPKEGEWFWFYPDKDCPPTLTRLDSFSRIGSMSKIYCEPFIGELPKFLKEVT